MKKIVVIMAVFAISLFCVRASACTGARPMAMGGAFIGLADDANVTYWNPAAIVFLSEESMEAHTGDAYEWRYPENNTMVAKLSPKRGVGVSDTHNRVGGRMFFKYNTEMLVPSGPNIFVFSWESFDWVRVEEKWQTVSYSQRLSERSAIGVNVRIATPVRPYQSQAVESYLAKVAKYRDIIRNPEGPLAVYRQDGPMVGRVKSIETILPSERYETDISYSLMVSDNVSFGVLLQNAAVWYGDSEGFMPSTQSLNPRAGIAYHNGRLKAGVDWYGGIKSSRINSLMAGVEYRIGQKILVRRGIYGYGERNFETAGLGVEISKESSLDLTRVEGHYSVGFSKVF